MGPWTQKLSKDKKRELQKRAESIRKEMYPKPSELIGNIPSYVKRRKLNKRVEETIRELVENKKYIVDERDLRTVHKSDRVPRSLEPEMTFSTNYWLIDHGFEEMFQ
jgi:hypothetical protein